MPPAPALLLQAGCFWEHRPRPWHGRAGHSLLQIHAASTEEACAQRAAQAAGPPHSTPARRRRGSSGPASRRPSASRSGRRAEPTRPSTASTRCSAVHKRRRKGAKHAHLTHGAASQPHSQPPSASQPSNPCAGRGEGGELAFGRDHSGAGRGAAEGKGSSHRFHQEAARLRSAHPPPSPVAWVNGRAGSAPRRGGRGGFPLGGGVAGLGWGGPGRAGPRGRGRDGGVRGEPDPEQGRRELPPALPHDQRAAGGGHHAGVFLPAAHHNPPQLHYPQPHGLRLHQVWVPLPAPSPRRAPGWGGRRRGARGARAGAVHAVAGRVRRALRELCGESLLWGAVLCRCPSSGLSAVLWLPLRKKNERVLWAVAKNGSPWAIKELSDDITQVVIYQVCSGQKWLLCAVIFM